MNILGAETLAGAIGQYIERSRRGEDGEYKISGIDVRNEHLVYAPSGAEMARMLIDTAVFIMGGPWSANVAFGIRKV